MCLVEISLTSFSMGCGLSCSFTFNNHKCPSVRQERNVGKFGVYEKTQRSSSPWNILLAVEQEFQHKLTASGLSPCPATNLQFSRNFAKKPHLLGKGMYKLILLTLSDIILPGESLELPHTYLPYQTRWRVGVGRWLSG